MEVHGRRKTTISIGVAEFINRLFVNGHLAEKSVFVVALATLCLTTGFFLGRYTMTQQIVALNQRPVSKQVNRVVASVNPPAPAEVVAVPKPVEVAEVPPKNDLYYSVRVASAKTKNEISKASKKFEMQCGHIETEFNSKLNRHILYCGKFQDLESAELFFQKLNVNGKLIVHRSPAAL